MPLDNPQELLYQVDAQDNEIGQIPREQAHSHPHIIHRSVIILITNQAEQMLFQKRSLQKDLYPGYWALACSGHVTYGQTYRQAAIRELQEELGISPELFYVTQHLFETPKESEMTQIFIAKHSQTPTNFNSHEIEQLRWVNFNQIPEFVQSNQIPPTDYQTLELLMYINNPSH